MGEHGCDLGRASRLVGLARVKGQTRNQLNAGICGPVDSTGEEGHNSSIKSSISWKPLHPILLACDGVWRTLVGFACACVPSRRGGVGISGAGRPRSVAPDCCRLIAKGIESPSIELLLLDRTLSSIPQFGLEGLRRADMESPLRKRRRFCKSDIHCVFVRSKAFCHSSGG